MSVILEAISLIYTTINIKGVHQGIDVKAAAVVSLECGKKVMRLEIGRGRWTCLSPSPTCRRGWLSLPRASASPTPARSLLISAVEFHSTWIFCCFIVRSILFL